MKHIFTLLLLALFTTANAQYLLRIDGETPDPFSDREGYNDITFVGVPLNTDNAIEFPTGSDYLKIEPFVDFDLDADWTVSFDINVSSVMDSIYIIDWRSNSSVGHMHIAYNGDRGLYFSDRAVNGIYGSSVADTVALPADTWVHFDVAREGDSLFIDRDGSQVASNYFVDALSPLSTTTIGYSEDFRYAHASFMLDNLTLTANPVASITEANAFEFEMYPNPANETLHFSTAENIELVTVYNMLGKTILSSNVSTQKMDVSKLNAGLYILQLQSENGISVKRFIKK